MHQTIKCIDPRKLIHALVISSNQLYYISLKQGFHPYNDRRTNVGQMLAYFNMYCLYIEKKMQ